MLETDLRPLRFMRFKEPRALAPSNRLHTSDAAPTVSSDYVDSSWAQLFDETLAPGTVIFDPTYFCNMACSFCDLPITSRLMVSFDRIKPVLASLSFAGLRDLVLSGGEPGITSNFDEIVRYSASRNYRIRMLTNGTWAAKTKNAQRRVEAGIHEVVLSLKGTDAPTARTLSGVDCHESQVKAVLNLSRLVQRDVLPHLTINHVLCEQTLDGLSDVVEWLRHLPSPPSFVLSLIEPYTDTMQELVPSPDRLRNRIPAIADALQEAGMALTLEGFPLCVLGDRWNLSRDIGRNRDTTTKIFIKPEQDADYVLFYRGYQRIKQFAHAPVCDGCALKPRCPGIHKKYRRSWASALRPFEHSEVGS